MTERRYGDDEVREIFSLATTGEAPGRPQGADSSGFTLQELQRIGEEAGIEPAQVAHAAATFGVREQVTPLRRSLGVPVGVSRVVELPRAPTDREWKQLISEFRTTFGVQGNSTTSGGLRDWSHGNLHISVEPTQLGQQLRLSTLKDDAIALNVLGVVMGGMSVIAGAVAVAGGKPEKALAIFGLFGGISLFSFAANAIRMPRWARERKQQMETIGEHVVKMLSNS